ncbi:MAG: hypothetical protein EAZ53_14330 [Bacteroidetes bacterium]|nr:MAG: hypothetical protein EAZ53_14330 [Bacteroidota bacterium]
MAQSIPIEAYKTLEKEFGRAVADKVTSLLDFSFAQADNRIEQIAIQKKLEIREELSKELASKADLAVLKSELDKKITVWSVVIVAVVVITNIKSLEFIAKIAGLIK